MGRITAVAGHVYAGRPRRCRRYLGLIPRARLRPDSDRGSERPTYLILEFQADQWFNRHITDDAPYR
ncbi:MAG: hypothetical protein WCJ23_04530 [Verrucomicrobiota bacterium]